MGVLEEEAAGSRAQCLVGVLVEVEGGQDEDAGAVACGDDPAGGLDAVHAGHPYVHQDHVGAQFGGHPHRLAAVARLADHLGVGGGLQQHAETQALEWLVVHDEHGRHAAPPVVPVSGVVSRVARTVQPPPGAGPAVTVPW